VRRLRRTGGCAGALLIVIAVPLAAPHAAACDLVLTEHRSGRELKRIAMPAARPSAAIAFEHSVLGTTVTDTYAFRPHAVLVEERFAGTGYGLPYGAAPGERLVRDGEGWRLELQRPVDPLVVRPLPSQNMRLLLSSGPMRLADLSTQAIELQLRDCPAAAVAP
jgi:hypothetical protein